MTGLMEKIKRLISTREEEIRLEDAADFYYAEKEDSITDARAEANRLMKETEEIMGQLEQKLESLKDYNDEKGIQAVEDVAENLYNDRKKMIADFETGKDIRQHAENLQEFVEDLNDVSRKEGQVLNHIDTGSDGVLKTIQKLVQHDEDVRQFVEDRYVVVENHEELEKTLEQIHDKRDTKKQLRGEIDQAREKLGEIEQDLERKQEELDQLMTGEDWNTKEEIEDKIEQLEKEKKETVSELSRQVSRIERSLKKIIYSVENEDVEFDADVEKLRKLSDQKFSDLRSVDNVLQEAHDLIDRNDIVNQSQEERFPEAVQKLSGLKERKEEMKELSREIKNLRQELDGMDVEERRQEFLSQKERLERKLQETRDEADRKQEKIEGLESEIHDMEHELDQKLNSQLGIDVTFEDQSR